MLMAADVPDSEFDAQHALFRSSSDGGGGGAGGGGAGGLHVSTFVSRFFVDELRERRCEHCGHESALASQRLLAPLPPNLMLHLKRFRSELHTGIVTKLNTRVRVDERLSLAPHFEATHGEHEVEGTGMPDDGDEDAGGAGSTGGAMMPCSGCARSCRIMVSKTGKATTHAWRAWVKATSGRATTIRT